MSPLLQRSVAIDRTEQGGITDHVWFYDMQADGFSLDDKRQKMTENNIPDIVKEYAAGSKQSAKNKNQNVVIVGANEIRKNKYDLNISHYKPVEHLHVEYEKPEVIMDKVMVLEEEIVEYVRTIKKTME